MEQDATSKQPAIKKKSTVVGIILLSLLLGWLAGHVHAWAQRGVSEDRTRFALDHVADAMDKKLPFKLVGRWHFYPTPEGYAVEEIR